MKPLRFRVWHVPQIPMKSFNVEVPTYEEAVRLKDALGLYDLFQLENNIKPDYSNMNGIQIFDYSLSKQDMEDMELEDEWVDCDDEYELEDIIQNLIITGHIAPRTVTVGVSAGMIDAGKEVLLNVPGGEVEERSDQVVADIFRAMAATQIQERE
ncbi:superinfection exclusion [Serratia phage vB_SmaA_3M]|uniref:Putative superinfection exclusion protein n=1 Tax=Serratia phage vB_SmaA_3M TaxID=2419930 RepID=A0A3G2YS75_9CAUD|nr:superinfection exclusion [Serratia phage vB_SmaA_3M]AYP28362.1 putative superinfection exclusion protein [Serratia phage vB_SmaA_3M]